MKNAQIPGHTSLSTLISRLRDGKFVIPDFQREFEWKPWDVRDLIRSIFLDYYIGSLLLWKGNENNFKALSCEAIYGYQGSGNPEYIVLDGQQRLTAMYYAFLSPDKPFPTRKNKYNYFIRIDNFLNEEYDNAFFYDWTRKWGQFIGDTERQYAEHIFPLSVVGQKGWALPTWLKGYEEYWRDAAIQFEQTGEDAKAELATQNKKNADIFSSHLLSLTQDYQVSYIELDKQLEIDKVCDIFTQINSKGVQLDTFDLINALLKPKGIQLKHMWRKAAPRLAFIESQKMNVYVLQVMSILKQTYCSPKYLYYLLPGQEKTVRSPSGTHSKETLIRDVSEFQNNWEESANAIENAIKLLRHPQEFGVISSRHLPYASIVPVFSAIQAYVNNLPTELRLVAKRKVRLWYWASVFLSRYSGSVETTAARDFTDLKEWMNDDSKELEVIQELSERIESIDFRQESRRGTSTYNGIFNLLVIRGARDWISGNAPQHDDLDDHHIIPASKESELDSDGLIHSILNRTPLSAETNRNVIRDQWPYQYLPELIEQSGQDAVNILKSHFISENCVEILQREPSSLCDYEEFIEERQSLIKAAIKDLFVNEEFSIQFQSDL